MIAVWLFLYLGSLIQMLTLYRLDANRPATLVLLLPLLALPLLDRLGGRLPWLAGRAATRVAGLVSFGAALALARSLNLGFWETRHLGLAALSALAGGGLLLVLRALVRPEAAMGHWVWLAAWLYAAQWHPVLPFLGAGLSALLGGFGRWPESAAPGPGARRSAPFWTMALLGLVLAKPWYDFNLEGAWAPPLALFSLAAGAAALPRLRERVEPVPGSVLLVLLALPFLAYHPAWLPVWALAVGLCWGSLWVRLPRPLPVTRLSFGFLLGLLVSYALHSNLGLPILGRVLWWGS